MNAELQLGLKHLKCTQKQSEQKGVLVDMHQEPLAVSPTYRGLSAPQHWKEAHFNVSFTTCTATSSWKSNKTSTPAV